MKSSETLEYYDQNATDLIDRYNSADMSAVHQLLDRYIHPFDNVLDIGFGSGRDLLYLASRGVTGWGIDGSTAFVNALKEVQPEMARRLFHSVLPALSLPDSLQSCFDVIFSIAAWMHLPKEEHFEAILNIKKFVKPGGTVILSYSTIPREKDPRFFEAVSPEKTALLFESFGFSLIESATTTDGLGRDSIEWVTQVFRLEESSQKGIDQIESILAQDSKDTTYKFALLKAFSEIATSPLNRFATFKDGYVYFPVALIAEKWIGSYWKLMDTDRLIPQKKGGEKSKKLAFRNALESIITHYREQRNRTNPYYEFWSDFQNGLSKETAEYELIRQLFNSVISTIIKGPVTFSGSSFDDTDFFVLGDGAQSFSKRHSQLNPQSLIESCASIGIKQSAYHELYRYGSWISDSITLRWAKFTEKLMAQSGQSKSLGNIISLLSQDFIHERETAFARKVYDRYRQEFGQLKSVWSARNVAEYEVDHVLPYAVYGNNDLWNLMPASRSENNAKRDALVSTDLLKQQRHTIIGYWEYMQEKTENRFDQELYKTFNIDPTSNSWKDSLHAAICEQLEVTASIRGLKRWATG